MVTPVAVVVAVVVVIHVGNGGGCGGGLVSADHPDVVKAESVSALCGVCPHLRGSFVPAEGPFVLSRTGPQTFASFSDILNRTLAAFKAVNDIRFLVPWVASGWDRRVFSGLSATDTPCLDEMRTAASDAPCI